MEGDIFTNSKDNFFTKTQSLDDNFFIQQERMPKVSPHTLPKRHLNDYDYNILKDGAYKDVTDELFKLEYKISRAEDDIKIIEAKIQSAKDINDIDLAETLTIKKHNMEKDLQGLVEIYNDKGLAARISGGVSAKIKEKWNLGKNILNKISDKIISKLPGKLSAIPSIRSSLIKLENLSKNVDELMTLQIPYGENRDKYEQLSKYIVKANLIQTEISKFMKG